ncbi:anti-sigma factor family protein [Bacteroidota bacterium]
MNLLSDEILNKYIDGELDEELSKQVESRINSSEAERKNYKAFKLLHKNLSALQADNLRTDFTSLVMSRLGKKVIVPKEQRNFVYSISSFIILICLGIIGYVAYLIFSTYTPQSLLHCIISPR